MWGECSNGGRGEREIKKEESKLLPKIMLCF